MDGKAVMDAISDFDSALASEGTLLSSRQADEMLPDKHRDTLARKRKPRGWDSGKESLKFK